MINLTDKELMLAVSCVGHRGKQLVNELSQLDKQLDRNEEPTAKQFFEVSIVVIQLITATKLRLKLLKQLPPDDDIKKAIKNTLVALKAYEEFYDYYVLVKEGASTRA